MDNILVNVYMSSLVNLKLILYRHLLLCYSIYVLLYSWTCVKNVWEYKKFDRKK